MDRMNFETAQEVVAHPECYSAAEMRCAEAYLAGREDVFGVVNTNNLRVGDHVFRLDDTSLVSAIVGDSVIFQIAAGFTYHVDIQTLKDGRYMFVRGTLGVSEKLKEW